jgi:hypothetical protein
MKQKTNSYLLANCFHAGFLLGLFVDHKEKETCSPETPVDFQRTTRRYISKYSDLHTQSCEYLKSYKSLILRHKLKDQYISRIP